MEFQDRFEMGVVGGQGFVMGFSNICNKVKVPIFIPNYLDPPTWEFHRNRAIPTRKDQLPATFGATCLSESYPIPSSEDLQTEAHLGVSPS